MSIREGILVTSLIISQMSFGIDRGVLLSTSKDKSELSTELESLNEIRKDYESIRFAKNAAIYGIQKSADVAEAIGGGVPFLGSVTSLVKTVIVDTGIDGINALTDHILDSKIEDGVRGALYAAWEKDSQKIENAFAEQDHTRKVEKVYEIIEEFDAFGEHLSSRNLSTDERAVLNSRMILKLSDVTKELTYQSFNNTEEIQKLKTSRDKFHNYLENNFDNFKAFLNLDKEKEEVTSNAMNVTRSSGRAIASIMEKYSSEELTENKISDKDKNQLKNEMLKIDSAAKEIEAYLSKAGTIANNLLKGEDLKKANEVISIAMNATKIISGAARAYSGDPMGAMDVLVGASALLGKKKNDPENMRHAQIMKAFGQVFRNQRQIINNQEKIYDIQVKTYKLIAQVYRYSKESFSFLNERIDVMLGNQASILGNIIEFSDLKEELNSCGEFLNTRFSCRYEYLEGNGNINLCLSQIEKQRPVGDFRDFFIPFSKQMTSTVVRGQFSNFDALVEHFKDEDNIYAYQDCKHGLKSILSHDFHPIFKSISYPKKGTFASYNEAFVSPVYRPLLDLAKKYMMYDTKSANQFYVSLLMPHEKNKKLSLKHQNIIRIHKDKEEYDLLTYDQINDAMTDLIYTSALDVYLSYFTEISSYWDITTRSMEEVLSRSEIQKLSKRRVSRDIKNSYHKLAKLVNISVAQQNLLSGDIMIPLLSKILKHGAKHPDFSLVIKALKNNEYLSHNVVSYILKEAIDNHPKQVSLYEGYKRLSENGLKGCTYNASNGAYSNCHNQLLKNIKLPISFKDDHILLPDNKTKVKMISYEDLVSGKLTYSPFLYRTFALREQLYTKMSLFKDITKHALEENLYVW